MMDFSLAVVPAVVQVLPVNIEITASALHNR